MSEINITIEGGTSKRLLTAGKYCDRDIVVAATGSGGGGGTVSRLPPGYTELTYLQSDGNQYIDMGWLPQAGEVFTIEASLTSGTGECAFAGYPNEWEVYYKSGYGGMVPSVWGGATKIYKLNVPSSAVPYGERTTLAFRFESAQNAGSSYLFKYRLDSYPFNGRIYFAKVENSSGEKLHHFVPCINPDGEYGMYDLVTDVFNKNAGSGNFVPGDVASPGAGGCYIDVTDDSEGNVTITLIGLNAMDDDAGNVRIE